MTDLFISYARKDAEFVERLRNDFTLRHIAFWIDSEGLSTGTPSWETAIRDAIKESSAVIWVVSPDSFASRYVRDEIAIARGLGRKIYPVWASGDNWLDCVPLGTGEIQYADMRAGNYLKGLEALLKALSSSPATPSPLAVPLPTTPTLARGVEARNPYKGLSAFTEKDAGDFFGRAALIEQLCSALMERLVNGRDRFLAILGPSGAGKSSVVMAGVIPALRAGRLPNSKGWIYLPRMVPGAHPVEMLADALYTALGGSLTALEADLNAPGGRMLNRLMRQLASERVLLYIDQFEELFTLTTDPAERQQFIDLITHAATETDGKLIVILTMRADFYGHPMHYPQLGALMTANQQAVLPMTISELWEAVEHPARLPGVGLTFDDGLAAEIIFALRAPDQALAGALPLLEFTLTRLFAERDGARLTFASYRAMGGVGGAIGAHCETVFTGLPSAVQAQLGAVFLPLVTIDEDSSEATRRRALLDSLSPDSDAQMLITALVNNRLLQTGGEGDSLYLEIAHEALFRSWARLVQWIEITREDLRLLRQIEREARTWNRSYLLFSERLKTIHEAVERLGMGDQLDATLRDFIYPQALLLEELKNSATSHQRRLRIGDDLALLGDPRPGVGVGECGIPDIAWLPVAVSWDPVLIKTDENEIGPVTLSPFFIAQYQITFSQYQAFVSAADGFENPLWWQDFPPEYQPQALEDQRTPAPNNPRDSISWYQSVAFARWLNHRLANVELQHPSGAVLRIGVNAEVRLPLEWEWQWAAQGGAEARDYPWGAWDTKFTNTTSAGLGRAIAVGMYPQGATLFGALDMSGNLFEWCQNDKSNHLIFLGYDNNKNKVLRGGSFYDIQNLAATRFRYVDYPNLVDYGYGLRLVVSVPVSSLSVEQPDL